MAKSDLRENYIFNLANRIVVILSPLVVTPYITRVLGAEEIGNYTYANTVATYFAFFILMGLSIHGSKAVALAKKDANALNATFSNLVTIQFVNSVVVMALYAVYALVLGTKDRVMTGVQLLYILSATFDITWFFSGMERFKTMAIRNTFINLLSVVSIFLFVKNKDDLYIYALIKCGSVLISQLMLWPTILGSVKIIRPKLSLVLSEYSKVLLLFVPVIAESVFHNLDRVMLGALASYAAVSLYYYSRMITDLPQCFVTSINTIMYPRISSLIASGEEKQAKVYIHNSFTLINLLCIGMCFGLSSVADRFVGIYFGPDYAECAKYIPLLSPYVFLAAWNLTIRYQYLLPKSMESIYIKSVVFGVLVNTGLNALLIPVLGVSGAIVATILAELLIAFLQTIPIFKEIQAGRELVNAVAFSVFGVIMLKSLDLYEYLVPCVSILALVTEILLGAVLYILMAGAFLLLREKDARKIVIRFLRMRTK